AEFYFSKDIYREALRLFADLKADDAESSNAMLQKMGYCCQRMDDLKQALNYYQEAELLEPDNKWTLRKIAYCSRRLGQYEVALDYYQRLDKLQPDSTSVLMNMAICYFQQEKYQDALSVYFKMLYLSPDNPKIWRLITWCYFIIGNFASARKYCEKAIADHPINSDYLNLGHICLAENKLKEAVEAYSTGLRMTDDKTVFWNLFADDVKYLQANGVERDAMAMVADAVKYKEIT
ncbi:MAG TPA: tetratricopeptide repeat protein, partial [Paludibacteraceae bacterium]|nr:tetratricopeptide repeat protein [Paludibacteraceae bacterium]